MANKRNTEYEFPEPENEANRPGENELSNQDAMQLAEITFETEAETERLRHQVAHQQEQIEKLFQLVHKKTNPSAEKGNNGRHQDSAAVEEFKRRMRVLKRAYPNTRI